MTAQTITRKELAALTGLSKTKINNISHSKSLRFPYTIGKIGREYVWNRAQILDWMHNNNIHDDLPGISLNTMRESTLDNQLAVAFLTTRSACFGSSQHKSLTASRKPDLNRSLSEVEGHNDRNH